MIRRAIGAGTTLLLVGVFGALALAPGPAPRASSSVRDLPPATAEITRATLAATKTVTGTLGFGETMSAQAIGAAGAGVLTWQAEEGATVARGEPVFAIDGHAVPLFYGTTPFFRTLRFDGADFANFVWVELVEAEEDVREAELDVDVARARLAEAEMRLTDWTARKEDSVQEQPQTREFTDLTGAVRFAQSRHESMQRLHEIGAVSTVEAQSADRDVQSAEAQLEAAIREARRQAGLAQQDVSAARSALLQAERALDDARDQMTAMRSAADIDTDVMQLRDNLAALGYAGPAAEMVRAWQEDLGLAPDGEIEPGQIVVAPEAIRVAERVAEVGEVIQEAAATIPAYTPDQNVVLRYTGTAKLVTAPLAVADHAFAKAGGTVGITLPDGAEVEGLIAEVGAVVSDQQQTEVIIAIPDQAALGLLEAAAVDVEFVSDIREDVLTVPVSALLALPEGGFGLEVVEGGASRTVPVRTGLFANGRVEVSGDGLAEGTKVGAPG